MDVLTWRGHPSAHFYNSSYQHKSGGYIRLKAEWIMLQVSNVILRTGWMICISGRMTKRFVRAIPASIFDIILQTCVRCIIKSELCRLWGWFVLILMLPYHARNSPSVQWSSSYTWWEDPFKRKHKYFHTWLKYVLLHIPISLRFDLYNIRAQDIVSTRAMRDRFPLVLILA